MHRRRWIAAALLTTLGACALSDPAHAQGQKSAYDNIDIEQVAESLSKLGMHELLDQLALENKGTEAVRGIAIEAKIASAMAAQGPQRDKFLDQAVELLQKAVAETKNTTSPKDTLKRYGLMLKLAMTSGITKGEPYATALLFLYGGQADREALAAVTEQPIAILRQLDAEMAEMHMAWQGDPEKIMFYLQPLEILRNKTKYYGGMIRLCYGMSVTDTNKRLDSLRGAKTAVDGFLRGHDDEQIVYWSLLVAGRAERELGYYGNAAGYFRKAMSDKAPLQVRTSAAFEAVRNVIEHGQALAREGEMLAKQGQDQEAKQKAAAAESKFAQALEDTDKFAADAARGRDAVGVRYVDLLTTMLRSYLFEVRASVQEDPAKAGQYAANTQGALMEFVSKYPDPAVQRSFYALMYDKYRGQEDYEALNSVAIMAIGFREYELGQGDNAQALERSEKALRIICKRAESGKDKAAVYVHPHALWQLALIMNTRLDNLAAGKLFVELVKTYPNHALARKAAEFAVASLFGVYDERTKKKQEIAPATRDAYIQALESYAGNSEWAKDPDVAKWNFQLGEQCDYMAASTGSAAAWFLKAADAYDKVPGNLPEAMQARGRALQSRAHVLTSATKADGDKTQAAQKLVDKLLQYGMDAHTRMEQTSDRQMRKDLEIWGSEAELAAVEIQYDVMKNPRQAISILDSLPKRWPGADALKRSESLKIRKLVEIGKVPEAIVALDQFHKDQPKVADGLLPLLIDKVQDRIRNLRGDDLRKVELQRYQQNYYNLTSQLYNRVKNQPLDERYRITQTYADSLLEADKADEALDILMICQAHDDAKREKQMKVVDDLYAPKIAAVEAAAGDIDKLKSLLKDYETLLKENNIDPRRDDITGALANVTEAWGYYNRRPSQPERQAEVAASLRKGMATIAEILKKRVPVEAGNVFGLARAYHEIGKARKKEGQTKLSISAFRQAVAHYNRLLGGLRADNVDHQRMFWQAQLGYCECVLEALGSNKQAMKNLFGRVRRLRDESQTMGGYTPRFNKIQADAEELSR